MLAHWYRLRWRTRFVILVVFFVALGFGMDTVDHALGRSSPMIPSVVEMPTTWIAMMILLRDRAPKD